MVKYFICPHCGEKVPSNALVCPECGSDEEMGWSENTIYDGLSLDDDIQEISVSPARSWRTPGIFLIAAITLVAYLTVSVAWGICLIPLFLLIGGIVYYFVRIAPQMSHNQEKRLFRHLLMIAGGDRERVRRLITYERRRNPDADLHKLLADAIYRWERDNR